METSIEKQNYDYCEQTIALKQSLELHFLEIGKRLNDIQEGKLFQPRWESFTEYLMDMKLDKSKASRLINIYKTFIVQFAIEPQKLALAGGWTMLGEILPVVKGATKEVAEEWVEKATMHPQYELRAEIREARGGSDTTRVHEDGFIDLVGSIFIQRVNDVWTAQHVFDFDDGSPTVKKTYGPATSLDEIVHLLKVSD